jgi:hypothetical protein
MKVSSKLMSQFVLQEWDIVECSLIFNKCQHLYRHNLCQFHVLAEFFTQDDKIIYFFPQFRKWIESRMFNHYSFPIAGHNESNKWGLYIKWCESKKEGTIILEPILQTTLKANLMAIKCKKHEPSTIIGFSQYQRYTRLRWEKTRQITRRLF